MLPVMTLPLCGVASAPPPEQQAAQSAEEAAASTSLARLRDVARVLLVFSPAADSPSFQKQMEALGLKGGQRKVAEAELLERKVLVMAVLENASALPLRSTVVRTLGAGEATEARARYGAKPGKFQVVLIGLDGGEKISSNQAIDLRTLNATIDAMPMRQRELREKSPGR
jgi:hypothetical protein